MLKSVELMSETILNYLGEERCAALCALTDIFPYEPLNDGVLWVQYDGAGKITAVAAVGDKGRTAVFSSPEADFEELSFIVSDTVLTDKGLGLTVSDKKYLMRADACFDKASQALSPQRYEETALFTSRSGDISRRKMYRALKGLCRCCAVYENGVPVGEGFVTQAFDFAVITDVFVREEYRKSGRGSLMVKNLLKQLPVKSVYLICRGKLCGFYGKIGFDTVDTVYEYKIKEATKL